MVKGYDCKSYRLMPIGGSNPPPPKLTYVSLIMRIKSTGVSLWLFDGFWLILGLFFINYSLFLDEPFFDFSDWSAIHIICLFIGFVGIFSENKVRAMLGQWVPKDLTVMQAILSFWLTFERYTALIISFSGLHFLVPAEAELFDMVDLQAYLYAWATSTLLPVFFLILFATYLSYALNLSLSWARPTLLYFLFTCLILILLYSWFFLLCDLGLNSLSAWINTLDADVFYQQPRSGTVYDNWVGVVDVFDWHRTTSRPHALRFEELYSFFMTLLVFISVSITLFWWAYMGWGGLWGSSYISFAVLGVGIRLLDHLMLCSLWGVLALALTSFRVILRLPGEYFFW